MVNNQSTKKLINSSKIMNKKNKLQYGFAWMMFILMEIYQYFLIEVEATSSTPLSWYSQYTILESLPV